MNLGSVLTLLEVAGGAFVAGYANDTYVTPFVEKAVRPLQTNHTLSKVADTATCGATSFGLGKVVGVISQRAGRAVEAGGFLYTALKAITIFVPGAEAKLTVPNPLSLFRSSMATAASGGPSGTLERVPPSSAGASAPGATKAVPAGPGIPQLPAGAPVPAAVPAGVPAAYVVSGVGQLTSGNLDVGF